ncbi:VOC family protein [Acutalibacter sp. 1XD8-33]|uniref:VOC family protein n=1 Tax=Acutalibacter sp. 1XD8-33 TaxID=2320081 RepID=UPI000EA255A9|nr:VOC family protein [Acutalibacter sp. 1XD8-33]RKJ39383.1 VOC family protein [Acutalibacter sp. 1XD8-33]
MVFGIGLNVKSSKEAVDLYCRAFKLQLGYHVLNEDGSYFHSELSSQEGEPALSVVEASRETPAPVGNPVELGHFFESREDLEQALSLLREGGRVTMEPRELPWSPWAACVTDRFGVNWFLSLPNHRPPEDFQPGDEI